MFASISNEAWQPNADGKEICIMNDSGKAEGKYLIHLRGSRTERLKERKSDEKG